MNKSIVFWTVLAVVSGIFFLSAIRADAAPITRYNQVPCEDTSVVRSLMMASGFKVLNEGNGPNRQRRQLWSDGIAFILIELTTDGKMCALGAWKLDGQNS